MLLHVVILIGDIIEILSVIVVIVGVLFSRIYHLIQILQYSVTNYIKIQG